MLAGRDVDVHALLVLHHAAVGAEVDPALVRVLGHHQTSRADVASAVQLVDERHRELEQVDVLALEHVLHDRAGLDDAVRNRIVLRDLLAGGPHEIQVGVVEGQAQRQRHALERGVLGEQHPESLGVVLDVVIEHRGDRPAATLGDELREGPHLQVPIHPVDLLQLPETLDDLQPLPEVGVTGRPAGLDFLLGDLGCFYSGHIITAPSLEILSPVRCDIWMFIAAHGEYFHPVFQEPVPRENERVGGSFGHPHIAPRGRGRGPLLP